MVKNIKGWKESARARNLAMLCRNLERENVRIKEILAMQEAAAEAFGHWQPMETAPKIDRILLCIDGQDWAIGSWNKDAFDGPQWEDDGLEPVAFIVQPTHWMPLPHLPPGEVA